MACKRFRAETATGKLNFDTEQATLSQFKRLIVTSDRIMQSFASFIHGSEFMILSPWADGRDLHLFLTKPDEILDNYMERSIRFTPDNLLTESYNLAGALNFLHNQMVSPRGRRLRCAHLDLKPENILVSFPLGNRADEAPVGRWKISDFGLSKVEEAVTEGRVMPVDQADQDASMAPGNIARELSIQIPARGAGAFQPPEVQNTEAIKVSTRRDVWSYGCILAMVLAFALKGPEGVKEQTRKRDTRGVDDFFYRRLPRRSRTPVPSPEITAHNVDAEVKPNFKKWLEDAHNLADQQHAHWIKHTSTLILTLLDPNVTTRPEIFRAVDTLAFITTSTERLANNRFWGFDDCATPGDMIVVPPLETSQTLPELNTTFVGAIDHSPPSSASCTAPTPRSPRQDFTPSPGGSSSLWSHNDPTRSFAKVVPPRKCQGATIESFGHVAALWSGADVKLYNLSPLHADPTVWSTRSNTTTELDPLNLGPIFLPEASECKGVQLAGKWLALLERSAPSSFCIRLLSRNDGQQTFYQPQSMLPLSQAPDDFKLSSHGTLALRFRDRVEIRTSGGTASIPLDKEVAGMAFTRAGEVRISRIPPLRDA